MVSTMPKLAQVREAITRAGTDVWLQVDGGVDLTTIEIARDAGADTFVALPAVEVKGFPDPVTPYRLLA